VGGCGYSLAYLKIPAFKAKQANIPETLKRGNGFLTDDLLFIIQRLYDLHILANKLSRYADWAALQASGKKTEAIGICQAR